MSYSDYHMEEHFMACAAIGGLPDYIPAEWHDRIKIMTDERGLHFIWTGWSNGKGHGKVSINGEAKYVHRVVVERVDNITLATDDIVDHLCRHRGCINRACLEVVTMKENTDRGLGKDYQFKPAEEYEDPATRYADPLDKVFG